MDARPVSELFSRLTEHMAASDIKSADLLSKIASELDSEYVMTETTASFTLSTAFVVELLFL